MITLLLAVYVGAVQAPPASPAVPGTAGACEIRGRITDQETGRPIVRALVRLHSADRKQNLSTRTDEEGHYQFTGLEPGAFFGGADPGEFRATHLSVPFRPSPPLVLKPGESRTNVNLALPRARALTVRVVDETGEPLAGIRLRAISARDGSTPNPSWLRTTDDRGRLRLYRLPPGRYIVCAEAPLTTVRPGAASQRRERILRTCYPSASAEAQAEPVSLERADVEDLEIRMRRGRTFTISGTVSDSGGLPAPGAMVGFSVMERSGSSSMMIRVRDDGAFTVSNVEPGDYAITASLGGKDRPEHRRELEEAFVPVTIEASDLVDLRVQTTKAVEVAGRITFEDSGAKPPRFPDGPGLLIGTRLAGDQLPGGGSMSSAYAGDDPLFILGPVFGRRTIEVLNVPPGWYVKAILHQGKDITAVATELQASRDHSALEIVLSNRGAAISGRVANDRGEPARGARVVLLPADPTQWSHRQVTSVGVTPTGMFRIGPVRAGDYLVVALDPSVPVPTADDRERLARVAAAAERITLGDQEARTIDLRAIKAP